MTDETRARTYKPTALSEFLRKYREDNRLTQEELAIKIGRARTALAGWEFGRGVSVKNRAHIAKALGVKPDVLGPAWDPQEPRSAYKRRITDADRAARAHFLDDSDVTDRLPSALPLSGFPKGAEAVADAALFRKLAGYWAAMEPSQRQELVTTAWRLASPDPAATPTEARPGQRRHG